MLSAVLVFLLLLIALLAIPVSLIFKMSWQQRFQGQITLQWVFGLVSVRIPTSSTSTSPPKDKTTKSKRSARRKTNFSAVIWQKAFRRRIFKFISDFWQAIDKNNVRLHLRIGLGDPADTGQLWAVVGPVAGVLTNVQTAAISIEPDFFDSTFEFDSSGNIRLIPLQMILIILGLLLSPPLWRGLRQMRT